MQFCLCPLFRWTLPFFHPCLYHGTTCIEVLQNQGAHYPLSARAGSCSFLFVSTQDKGGSLIRVAILRPGSQQGKMEASEKLMVPLERPREAGSYAMKKITHLTSWEVTHKTHVTASGPGVGCAQTRLFTIPNIAHTHARTQEHAGPHGLYTRPYVLYAWKAREANKSRSIMLQLCISLHACSSETLGLT